MNLKPLHDRVVVEKIEEPDMVGSLWIPDVAKEKPTRGRVLAVGPGSRARDGSIIPMGVKEGDEILFGKWSGTEAKIDGRTILVMGEGDIMGVLT
jgi:chaperonin GroES